VFVSRYCGFCEQRFSKLSFEEYWFENTCRKSLALISNL